MNANICCCSGLVAMHGVGGVSKPLGFSYYTWCWGLSKPFMFGDYVWCWGLNDDEQQQMSESWGVGKSQLPSRPSLCPADPLFIRLAL